MTEPFDIVVCLSETPKPGHSPGDIRVALTTELGLADSDALVTLADQSDKVGGSIAQFLRAVRRAVALRRHLVVVFDDAIPTQTVVTEIFQVLMDDPLFGSAQPRFASHDTNRVCPLPVTCSLSAHYAVPRQFLVQTPPTTITPELLAGCLALRWNAIASVDDLDRNYTTCEGTLLDMMCKMRRRGFRNVVVNKSVLPTRLSTKKAYPTPPRVDLERLQKRYPEQALAQQEMRLLAQRRYEALASEVDAEPGYGRVLIDCRDIPARHNGSTQCALGLLEGFAALPTAAQIDVVVSSATAEFHEMRARYPTLGNFQRDVCGEYFAAITLTQPWSVKAVADLHHHAFVLAFMMLDTIAWDILYAPSADALGTVWRFIARHADGLFYISEFTRQRFHARFPVDVRVTERVTYLSLAQHEHIHPDADVGSPPNDRILVFGNHFDHKDVSRTTKLLADAFPFRQIVAFGTDESFSDNVRAVPSGLIGEPELHALIASARVLVYPSYYEGFGLPVVEALAYGRPVVVRRSPLWTEIAGHSQLPGSLIEFDDAASLVQTVGRSLAGVPQETVQMGSQLHDGAAPPDWRCCANRVLELLHDCIRSATYKHWLERDEAVAAAGL